MDWSTEPQRATTKGETPTGGANGVETPPGRIPPPNTRPRRSPAAHSDPMPIHRKQPRLGSLQAPRRASQASPPGLRRIWESSPVACAEVPEMGTLPALQVLLGTTTGSSTSENRLPRGQSAGTCILGSRPSRLQPPGRWGTPSGCELLRPVECSVRLAPPTLRLRIFLASGHPGLRGPSAPCARRGQQT